MQTEKVVMDLSRAHRLIAPRIAYIITTLDVKGRCNAASFTNLTSVSTNPQRLIFATVREWDTFLNVKSTREFVVNVPGKSLLDAVWICGDKYAGFPIPRGTNELRIAGLTEIPSLKVKPPRIKECFGHLECRVIWIRNVGDHSVILGQVVEATSNSSAFGDDSSQNIEVTMPLMQISGPFFTCPTSRLVVDTKKTKQLVKSKLKLV